MVYQREKGDSGTEHFQGVVWFKSRRTFKSVKKMLPSAHLEPMKGTLDQAIHYCSKPVPECDCNHCKNASPALAGPWTSGEKPAGQGARVDLTVVKEMIDSGKSEKEIADSAFGTWCRYYRAFNRYRLLTSCGREWQTEVVVYWGPPGTGKSRHALELGGASQFWLPQPKSAGGCVWWDGYDGQETVVIDEFYGWIPRSSLQRLVDRYPLMVETKGGSVPFVAKRIIITSNKSPSTWYPRIGLGAMARRLEAPIGFVFFFGEGGLIDANAQAAYEQEFVPLAAPMR